MAFYRWRVFLFLIFFDLFPWILNVFAARSLFPQWRSNPSPYLCLPLLSMSSPTTFTLSTKEFCPNTRLPKVGVVHWVPKDEIWPKGDELLPNVGLLQNVGEDATPNAEVDWPKVVVLPKPLLESQKLKHCLKARICWLECKGSGTKCNFFEWILQSKGLDEPLQLLLHSTRPL